MNIIRELRRKIYCYRKWRRYNRNHNPTIISENCIGGVVSHDMGLEFMSPTVNLYFLPGDFIKLCSNLKYYLAQQLKWIKTEFEFPVAMLDDITVYFMHYKTEQEAERKWNARKDRVNYDNMFFIMTDKDGCTQEDLKKFDALTGCKNKVVFTSKKYPEIKSAFYLEKFKDENEIGIITNYNKPSCKRDLDEFDWVKFLND